MLRLLDSPPLAQILDANAGPGTDQSQGRGQIISNINACLAVQSTIKGTLGPYGGDLLMVDENGRQTITNDGATVMKVRAILYAPRSPFDQYNSSSTSCTPLPASSQTLRAHKMPKLATERPRSWSWRARYSRRSRTTLSRA